ncbi:MAG: ABC transporter ATP-binding protein [Acetatifactor sp.]|nr:ABC transporter ATP-binding protein [Acetatifactor sp.]
MKEVRRYFSYLGKYKRRYCVILAITVIVSAMLEILYARMYQTVFGAAEHGDHVLFVRGAALCVITVILYCLFPWLRYFEIHVVRKVVFEIKLQLFRKLLRMNMSYYESHHSGEGLKILNWDANSLKDSYFSHVYWVICVAADGVAAMIAMFMYTPLLTIISMMFCAVTVWLSLWINREVKCQNRKLQESLTELTKRLSDILSGFVLLKMYRGAFLVTEHYKQENERVTRDEKIRVQKAALLDMLSFLMGILAGFGTMFVGILLVSTGKLSYGTVMAVVSLQIGVSEMMQRLGFSLNTFSASLVKAERVFNFLEMDREEENIDNVPERETEPLESQPVIPLLIEKLDFAYDGEKKVLDHFTLRAEEGDKILLSGESGCGKSTLLKLLLRFYDGSVGKKYACLAVR